MQMEVIFILCQAEGAAERRGWLQRVASALERATSAPCGACKRSGTVLQARVRKAFFPHPRTRISESGSLRFPQKRPINRV
jgi:hypothetical protein